jgi:hypothetical protein
MATTEIRQFGGGGTGSPNVLTQAQFDTFLAGIAGNSFANGAIPSAQQFNKILRQSSFMAAGLANWLVNRGISVADDANLAALVAEIQAGMSAYLTKSIAGSANVTLDPVLEANFNMINLTGAITANLQVIVPSAAGEWTFKNATTGAFTVTVKTAAGTGIDIPQGTSLLVWSDGTNVYNAVSGVPTFTQAQGDLIWAKLAGLGTQQFSVAAATTARHAVAFDQALGLGQTWQNVAGSRAFATTYTNSTGKPIMVDIALTMAASSVTTLTVGGIVVGRLNTNTAGSNASFSAIVPTGTTYILTNTIGANTISEWTELR